MGIRESLAYTDFGFFEFIPKVVPFLLRNFYTGFHSGWINIHSHQQCYKEPQARILARIFVRFLDDSYSDWDEKESQCISLVTKDVEYLFIGHFYFF